MKHRFLAILICLLIASGASAQTNRWIEILNSDRWSIAIGESEDTTHLWGNVILQTETSTVYCDSAIWAAKTGVKLYRNVIVDDKEFRLAADDSVSYQLKSKQMEAHGSYVELWSIPDSLFMVGRQAFYDRTNEYAYMEQRPTIMLNYPDTANIVEITANSVQYDAQNSRSEAEGDVLIKNKDMNATADCAVMWPDKDELELYGSPELSRRDSHVEGDVILLFSEDKLIRRIDIIDAARAVFSEPVDVRGTFVDSSILNGDRMIMDFLAGDLRGVACFGEAYSWYFPSARGGPEESQNSVSGDSIYFTLANDELMKVEVVGGAIGQFLNTKKQVREQDSAAVPDSVAQLEQLLAEAESAESDSLSIDSTEPSTVAITDTIDYAAKHISYSLKDSVITLDYDASTSSKTVSLTARRVMLDTKTRIIEAFSADTLASLSEDSLGAMERLQPGVVPVVLQDGEDQLLGDYLEYSLDTEKGRIVTSKSKYETGYFYGEDLYRQNRDVYYLCDGRYTTCDLDHPHFHFHSKNLKLIEGKRLIAKPVVFYLGALPIFYVPYYVFPLEKGRRSGILPFTLGNIERGERYIRNLGYYWAASDYWDWQGAIDYFEEGNSLNFFSKVTYKKLYNFDGYLSGNYLRETGYDADSASETGRTRWTLEGDHDHTFSPSFKMGGSFKIQSDDRFYNDYSTSLDDRLDRVLRSNFNFTKRFGRSVSLSGYMSHDDYLDEEKRIDQIPNLDLTLPRWTPFGTETTDSEGNKVRRWYHNLVVSYSPHLRNYSYRETLDEYVNQLYDTTFVIDTVITEIDSVTFDTSYVEDTTITLASQDTLSYRSRKAYTRLNHNFSVQFPQTVMRYINVTPSLSYNESWVIVQPTDQSYEAGIDHKKFYRTNNFSASIGVSTKVYGTMTPNIAGLTGFRQVLSPRISYSFTPLSDHYPTISSYAGAVRSTSKSQRLNFSLDQLYQVKVKQGEIEKAYDLVSIGSDLSYNFEATGRKFSNISTNFTSTLLPDIRFQGSMTHSIYPQDSDEANFLQPRLTDFDLTTTLNITGSRFFFDDANYTVPYGADYAPHLLSGEEGDRSGAGPGPSGFSLTVSYSYRESSRDTDFATKSSAVSLSARFNLTPSTSIAYSQYYDIVRKKTITNRVEIHRQIHCWQGYFWWVPTGSTRGWGFRLNVIAIPEIKLDNNQSTLKTGYLLDQR